MRVYNGVVLGGSVSFTKIVRNLSIRVFSWRAWIRSSRMSAKCQVRSKARVQLNPSLAWPFFRLSRQVAQRYHQSGIHNHHPASRDKKRNSKAGTEGGFIDALPG